MRTRGAISLLALAGLAIAACGSDDGATDSGSAPTAADLSGRGFVSTDVTGHDLVEGSEISVNFLDDAVSVNAGCNTLNGGYEITDGTFVAGAFTSTMMACDDALMGQDTWLGEFLSSSPAIELDGSTLTLTGDESTITFDEVEPAALVGTTWVVSGTVANEAVTVSVVDSEASMTITDDQAQIDTGCNTGSSTVEITDTTITFGPIALTRMACDEELTRLENSVLAVLQGEVAYEIDGDRLSLRSGDGADQVGLDLTAS
ncbi:MAG TPA: META domain-containing protein [Ilumatobacteraceae bacterium]|nr:META domain-containing protein [Ilumatobacteraceae bacterium]